MSFDSSSVYAPVTSCSDGSRVIICTSMSDTANSLGSVMPRSFAAAITARRVVARSSATVPTSVVSM